MMLGCGKSVAFIYDQGGEKQIGELTSVVNMAYGRVLDDVSETSVTIAGPIDESCCELLGKIEPWRHEVVIFRDGKRSWEGPVRNIEMQQGQVVLSARDVFSWTDRQIHEGISSGVKETPVQFFNSGISAAFFNFDPNVLAYRKFPYGFGGQIPITHEVQPRSGYYGDDLRSLADQGVNFTVLGRSIIIWREQRQLGRTQPLITGEHYLGNVKFIVSGDDYVSEAMARDKNDVFVTRQATTRPYYGRVQRLVDGGSAEGPDDMAYLAQLEVDRHGRQMPVILVPPADATLSPEAPVTLEDLVPGMVVPLSVTDPICRKFSADMILTEVNVIDDADGETISIGLVPIGTDNVGGQTKPWTMKRKLIQQDRINRINDAYRRTHP